MQSAYQTARGERPARPLRVSYPRTIVSILLVCSTGGHLKELQRLRRRIPDVGEAPLWVTFDSPQSRSLLEGERVEWARYVGSRNPGSVARNTALAARVLRSGSYTRIVSTGSAIALSFMPLARLRGIECHFIESAARGDGPSLTGRITSHIPGVRLYTQYPSWASGRWRYAGSVLDGFRPAPTREPGAVRRVVVLLGTMEHGFRRLVERLIEILPADAEVLWQTGSTDMTGLPVRGRPYVPAAELEEAIRDSDVLVAHSGMGAALTAFELGRAPVLVPRRGHLREHIDDHQTHIAAELDRRGLAVTSDASELKLADLERAAALRVEEPSDVPAFRLV